MTSSTPSLLFLISGNGSNLQAFIDQVGELRLNAHICCVISNKADAFGLQRARSAGIATEVIEHKHYSERADFDQAMAAVIDRHQPDLIVLAGFMRILTSAFVEKYQGRMLNIHPSLLPKYPGLNTHQRAIEAKDDYAGATVHFVTAELDGGPPIIQAKVSISSHDSAESLAAKVQLIEHEIYPLAAQWFLQARLQLKPNGAFLDDKKLPETGFDYSPREAG